jgi:hypothetical protein
MDVMTLAQLGEKTNLDPQTVLAYRDAWLLFIPAIRVGGSVAFPAEATEVISTIHALKNSGQSDTAITAALEEQYPVTVIASQPIANPGPMTNSATSTPVTGLLQDVDAGYRSLNTELNQIREDLGKTASEQRAIQIQQLLTGVAASTSRTLEPLGVMQTELTQIRQVIGMLAGRIDHQQAAVTSDRAELAVMIDALRDRLPDQAPGITGELNAVRLELAELRASLPGGESQPALRTMTGELGTIREQLTDLHKERRHMITLLSALQDNLAQLQIELADARQQARIPAPAHSLLEMVAAGAGFSGIEHETGSLRTPRRLGHQGK